MSKTFSQLRIAKKKALKVTTRRQRHSCLILQGGRLLTSVNNEKGHAEQIAIAKGLVSRPTLHNTTLISFRIKPNGEIGNSKPCVNCRKAINETDIRRIIYFDGKKWVEEFR